MGGGGGGGRTGPPYRNRNRCRLRRAVSPPPRVPTCRVRRRECHPRTLPSPRRHGVSLTHSLTRPLPHSPARSVSPAGEWVAPSRPGGPFRASGTPPLRLGVVPSATDADGIVVVRAHSRPDPGAQCGAGPSAAAAAAVDSLLACGLFGSWRAGRRLLDRQ